MNWHDIIERAAWTFVQGAIGAVATIPAVTDAAGWVALGYAALSAGIAALVSFIKSIAQERGIVADTRSE